MEVKEILVVGENGTTIRLNPDRVEELFVSKIVPDEVPLSAEPKCFCHCGKLVERYCPLHGSPVPIAEGQEWWPVVDSSRGDFYKVLDGGVSHTFPDGVPSKRFVTAVWETPAREIVRSPVAPTWCPTHTKRWFYIGDDCPCVACATVACKLLGVIMQKEAK